MWSQKESIGYTMIKSGHMVLKGVNWVLNTKNRSHGFERSDMGRNDKIRSNRLGRNQLDTKETETILCFGA